MKFEVVSNGIFLFGINVLFLTSPSYEEETVLPSEAEDDRSNIKTYIVHVEKPKSRVSAQLDDLESWHHSFLPATTASLDKKSNMIYSYRHAINGFAARLTDEEAKAMEKKDGVLLVRPATSLQLHTTHGPSFLGLHQEVGFWKEANLGKGVIIGVIDTGISPNHPSFSDKGMPPPPAKWKGKCEFEGMACNNKLIGARTFHSSSGQTKGVSSMSPLDHVGHGTHVSSIAAGNFVEGANVLGNAKGTAAGVAPLAHLAIYKACSIESCHAIDLLAAVDTAIEDGVDVLSMSLSAGPFQSFLNDIVAICSFSAIQRGIFVSTSAGNIGPFNRTVANMAPWVLTVGASTTDRMIKATARIQTGETFDGESLFQPSNFKSPLLPLVYAGAIASYPYCSPGSLTNVQLKGEVVLCEGGAGMAGIARGEEVKNAGGSAMILMNDELEGFTTFAAEHVLPATHVSHAAGLKIKAYINSTSKPTATILFKGTVLYGKSSAPMVSYFSSRGPSVASPGILKPDIIGPGVNILAAWPPLGINSTRFFIDSGTSMSCAHLSGIAALLKASHPEWSPAAIKSAIMTTADALNLEGKPIIDYTKIPANIFATGAGHVNPSKASDPGLVYDIQPDDYIPYLCRLNYTNHEVKMITQRNLNCMEVKSIPEAQLNYPSFSIVLGSSPQTFTRTLTNVGQPSSSYIVKMVWPQGVSVHVIPEKLIFKELNQKETYTVTFSRSNCSVSMNNSGYAGDKFAQGYLKWVSQKYSVRSPIAVMFDEADA